MAERNQNTQTHIGEIVDKGAYDSGAFFPMKLGKLLIGRQCIERAVLPMLERQFLFLLLDRPDAAPSERPYAKDTTVMITGVNGIEIEVADLRREEGFLIPGEPRTHRVTSDGLILAEGVTQDAMRRFGSDITDLTAGYFLPFSGLESDESQFALVPASKPVTIDTVANGELPPEEEWPPAKFR